jgi:hypothetical protein
MHYCSFVMIGPDINIEDAVQEALAPFDSNATVEPYRVWMTHADVRRMAKHYRIHPAKLHDLAKQMADWTGCQGGVDWRGLYRLTADNPDGRWDWYEIGGRWDGYIPHVRGNVIRAGTLAKADYLSNCLPNFLLTPEAEWIERERYYFGDDWKHVQKEELKASQWLELVRQSLGRWPHHKVVCVDIHC